MYYKAPIVSDNVSNKDYIVHLVSIKFQPQGSDKHFNKANIKFLKSHHGLVGHGRKTADIHNKDSSSSTKTTTRTK